MKNRTKTQAAKYFKNNYRDYVDKLTGELNYTNLAEDFWANELAENQQTDAYFELVCEWIFDWAESFCPSGDWLYKLKIEQGLGHQ